MSFKRFAKIIFFVLALYVAFNFITFELFTKELLVRKASNVITGDLTRMGYISGLNHERKNILDLPKQHIKAKNFNHQNIDMITIGDSFSQGNAGGYNRYYQDFFATDLNISVLNLTQHSKTYNYLETIILLLNSGFLEKYKVKYILLESTQRKIVDRFASSYRDFLSETLQDLDEEYFVKDEVSNFELPKVGFINDANFKYYAYKLFYHFSPNAFISKVTKLRLDKKMFSIKDGKDLLFYKKDISSIKRHSKENLEKVNDNLNLLSQTLKSKGVELIFMPAISKYDLYYPYISNNPYEKDELFDIFRNLKKEYIFLDTKEILSKEIDKGELDLFFVDDTHWSYKASAAISKDLKKVLHEN